MSFSFTDMRSFTDNSLRQKWSQNTASISATILCCATLRSLPLINTRLVMRSINIACLLIRSCQLLRQVEVHSIGLVPGSSTRHVQVMNRADVLSRLVHILDRCHWRRLAHQRVRVPRIPILFSLLVDLTQSLIDHPIMSRLWRLLTIGVLTVLDHLLIRDHRAAVWVLLLLTLGMHACLLV